MTVDASLVASMSARTKPCSWSTSLRVSCCISWTSMPFGRCFVPSHGFVTSSVDAIDGALEARVEEFPKRPEQCSRDGSQHKARGFYSWRLRV